MTDKSIYIHIGIPKTGTTALQHFFNENPLSLEKNNIYYPNSCRSTVAHHGLSYAMADGTRENVEHEIQTLKTEIESCKCSRILISSEAFSRLHNVNPIFEKLSEFNIFIIVYLRRQDLWIESAYKQNVKSHRDRSNITFSEYLHSKSYSNRTHFKRMLAPWEKCFGQNNIIVKTYEPGLLKDNIFSDFMSIFDVNDISEFHLPTQDSKLNHSLNNQLTDFLRVCNSLSLSEKEHLALVEDLVRIQRSSLLPEYPKTDLFQPGQREKFLSDFKKVNNSIAKTYLKRDKLFLDNSKNSEIKEKYNELSLDMILEIFKSLLVVNKFISSEENNEPKSNYVNISKLIKANMNKVKKMPTKAKALNWIKKKLNKK